MSDPRRIRFLGLTPCLSYEDAGAALAWLRRVFGFEERRRFIGADGRVQEAVLRAGEAVILLTARGATSSRQDAISDSITQRCILYVDDIDVHHASVRAAGIDAPAPERDSCGSRIYRVEDLEGHGWAFCQRRGLPPFSGRANRDR